MRIMDDFNDITIINDKGVVEYCNIQSADFFDLTPEALIGSKVTQWYQNRDDESSTMMQVVINGRQTLNYVDTLITGAGKTVRQVSDSLCIKDGDRIVGAIEFAKYDPEKDLISKEDKSIIKRRALESEKTINDFVGNATEILKIKSKLNKVKNLEASILITGETGTGKETLARLIHSISNRTEHEFVYINCGSLPEGLLESILFGTEKGSFTDSDDRDGLFALADKGTIFLDELNNMPLPVQGKLLKAIEDKRIRKVGGKEDIPVDVRVMASCNTTVEDLIQNGEIRTDLFFRLSSIQFELPALRERIEDIEVLAGYFIGHFNKRFNKNVEMLSNEAVNLLKEYDWPGNVRELRNVIESAFHTVTTSCIDVENIKDRLEMIGVKQNNRILWDEFEKSGMDLRIFLKEKEKEIILNILKEEEGDLNKTAKRLKISKTLLNKKLCDFKEDIK